MLRSCDIEDARRVALQLEIPFYVFHLREEFEKEVIHIFVKNTLREKRPILASSVMRK